MSETTAPKQSIATRIVGGVKQHQTKILVVTSVASTATAVMMGVGIKQHNAFLKEHGLFEQFYDITPTEG